MHPTKQRLIEVTNTIYEKQALHTITAELVLRESGVTKGSLYHHFQDFSDLIEHVLVLRHETFASLELSAMNLEIDGSSGIETARARLFTALRNRQDSTSSSDRSERALILSQSLTNQRLSAKILVVDERITQLWMALYSSCAHRGWTSSYLDPRSVSAVIQGAIFGRVFIDLQSEELAMENWMVIVEAVADRLYFSNRIAV